MKDFNDDEAVDLVCLGETRSLHVRFIEFMPFLRNKWDESRMVPSAKLQKHIESVLGPLERQETEPQSTATVWKVPGFLGTVGFISSMTANFCGSCTRLRLTADGNIRNCLFAQQEFALREVLRTDQSDKPIMQLVQTALQEKKLSHGGIATILESAQHRPMVAIGG
eukprot:Platyproteum_vivax@DN5668_c0_g1_i2.p2